MPCSGCFSLRWSESQLKKSNTIVIISSRIVESIGFKWWLCKNNHRLTDCRNFTSKLVSNRKQFMKEHKLCWNCLSNKHTVTACKLKFWYLKDSNTKCHHTLIHKEVNISKRRMLPLIMLVSLKIKKRSTRKLYVYISKEQTSIPEHY